MSDVTGPISTLPGAPHSHPEGMMCDGHPDRPAVLRVQGETDSFGAEMYDLCAECAEARRTAPREDNIGSCDWCKAREQKLLPRRDYEEGMSGPVYYVCKPCGDRSDKRLAAEMDEYYDDRCDWDD